MMAGAKHESAEELIDMAVSMPQGNARQRMLEEAARLADATGDLPEAFNARFQIVEDSYWIDKPEAFLTAFSWCLQRVKEDRKQFNHAVFNMTWAFKSVINTAIGFPEVTLSQLEALLDQMEEWYLQEGYSLKPVLDDRSTLAAHTGDIASARRYFSEMLAAERDIMADCPACEANGKVWIFTRFGDSKEVVRAAEPILNGNLRCRTIPHRTLGLVLHSQALLGMYDEADDCHQRGYRMIRKDPQFLGNITSHVFYLLHRDNLARALQLVERHFAWLGESNCLLSKYDFYLVFRKTLESLLSKKGARKSRQLKLPQDFPLYEPEGKYDLCVLHDWALSEERKIATRFDARNGTENFCKTLPEHYSY